MKLIDADLLSKELEKKIKVNESHFEPWLTYATCTVDTIATTYSYGIPIGRRFSQCEHCGAPGQVIGGLCEYCGQVIDG